MDLVVVDANSIEVMHYTTKIIWIAGYVNGIYAVHTLFQANYRGFLGSCGFIQFSRLIVASAF